MTMTPVKSSNIAAVDYEDTTGVLLVRFIGSEGIHRYAGVPHATYQKLLHAKSVGSFFAQEIRGQFAHTPPAKKDAPSGAQ